MTQSSVAVRAVGQEKRESEFMGTLLRQGCQGGNLRGPLGEEFLQRTNRCVLGLWLQARAPPGDSGDVCVLGMFTPSCLMASGGDYQSEGGGLLFKSSPPSIKESGRQSQTPADRLA